MKKILSHIPTNIITGFLGAGKTTLIRHLLKTKPADEKWAVLVNEFGEVGIDGALLAADGIAVKEVPGGCMCCAVGLPSKVALNQLIRSHRPDRILIEPTGLAHPQQVVKQFSGAEYQTLLDMQTLVCIVDPWSIGDPIFTELPAFRSQIELADHIILTKADTATAEQLASFEQFCDNIRQTRAAQQRPVKFSIVVQGAADWQWLTHPHHSAATQTGAPQHAAVWAPSRTVASSVDGNTEPKALVTKPTRFENHADFGHSCGWRFPADWRFDETALLSWIETLDIPRVKGVIRTADRWLLVNRMRATVSSEEVSAATESRLEMIHTEAVNWDRVEVELLARRSAT
jgi:G3E family GTPase